MFGIVTLSNQEMKMMILWFLVFDQENEIDLLVNLVFILIRFHFEEGKVIQNLGVTFSSLLDTFCSMQVNLCLLLMTFYSLLLML